MTWNIQVGGGELTILSMPTIEPFVVTAGLNSVTIQEETKPQPARSRITPDLELQRAVRLALLATPDIAEHITSERIRSGLARPEDAPIIIMTPASVEILGHAAGRQKVAEIAMRLHIWTEAGQADTAQQITSAAMLALMDKPQIAACTIEGWDRPAMAWVPDPDPALSFAHAVIGLRAVVYWRAS